MIYHRKGHIQDNLHVLGHPAIPVYLLEGPAPILIDAGFACLGDVYLEEIGRVLGRRHPDCCCLTHAHFDHCGALAAFKKAFPAMQAAASPAAVDVLERPRAVERIRRLNQAARAMIHEYDVAAGQGAGGFEVFGIDRIIDDGDRFAFSDGSVVEVLATPGHTRDCLSFYLPEKKMLFCSEAAGQPDRTGYIVSDCLLDYGQYLASLQKLARLDVEILCPGHLFVYTGKSARHYLKQALEACFEFRDRVEQVAAQEKGDIHRMMARIKAHEYDGKPGPKQPEPAYLINLEARIASVLRSAAVRVDNTGRSGS